MPPLADVQSAVRTAMVHGDLSAAEPLLAGGATPRHRLAIHRRHYVTSLVNVLLNRFPATIWLVGSDLVTAAARAFVERHPPARPCMAEYGDGFPAFLAAQPGADALAYLESFATLEWHLGRLALAVDDPPGVHHMRVNWNVDELISIFLTGVEPERFSLEAGDIGLELRGSRGELHITRVAAEQMETER